MGAQKPRVDHIQRIERVDDARPTEKVASGAVSGTGRRAERPERPGRGGSRAPTTGTSDGDLRVRGFPLAQGDKLESPTGFEPVFRTGVAGGRESALGGLSLGDRLRLTRF